MIILQLCKYKRKEYTYIPARALLLVYRSLALGANLVDFFPVISGLLSGNLGTKNANFVEDEKKQL